MTDAPGDAMNLQKAAAPCELTSDNEGSLG